MPNVLVNALMLALLLAVVVAGATVILPFGGKNEKWFLAPLPAATFLLYAVYEFLTRAFAPEADIRVDLLVLKPLLLLVVLATGIRWWLWLRKKRWGSTGPRLSAYAAWSFALGLLTFILGPFSGIPAVVLGHAARREIRGSPEDFRGGWMAVTGLIAGYAGTILSAGLWLIWALFMSSGISPHMRNAIKNALAN